MRVAARKRRNTRVLLRIENYRGLGSLKDKIDKFLLNL